jgi:hypothetical protein
MSKKSIARLSADTIQAHILDPENSPLPAEYKEEFSRIIQASKLLDDYPNESHVIALLQSKYNISSYSCKRDIALAKELFKTQHTFDYDFMQSWMIKDQLELIRECRLDGDHKEWNKAKKVLKEIIGERPAASEDPRRMEKNVFYIQINNSGHSYNVPLDAIKGLSQKDIKELVDNLEDPIDETQAEEIMNT